MDINTDKSKKYDKTNEYLQRFKKQFTSLNTLECDLKNKENVGNVFEAGIREVLVPKTKSSMFGSFGNLTSIFFKKEEPLLPISEPRDFRINNNSILGNLRINRSQFAQSDSNNQKTINLPVNTESFTVKKTLNPETKNQDKTPTISELPNTNNDNFYTPVSLYPDLNLENPVLPIELLKQIEEEKRQEDKIRWLCDNRKMQKPSAPESEMSDHEVALQYPYQFFTFENREPVIPAVEEKISNNNNDQSIKLSEETTDHELEFPDVSMDDLDPQQSSSKKTRNLVPGN